MADHVPQEVRGQDTLTVLAPSDARWGELLGRLPLEKQDIFYRPEYAEIAAHYLHKGGEARCAALESGPLIALYPFLQRNFKTLLEGTGVEMPGGDAHGLYGRNGLLSSTDDPDFLGRFHSLLAAYCADHRLITGFDRYHPVMENHKIASPRTKLIDIGGFVVVNLNKPIEDIESHFKHSVRKHIKKAERSGVEAFSESGADHLDDFLKIYTHTMDRNNATRFYYVDPGFYRALAERLPEGVRFFYAKVDGVIVSCELVLFHGHYAHSFLGGTLGDYLDKCPNHILKREIIRHARARGCRHYLLGGGDTPFNGVWAYKLCFDPDGNRSSFVGGTVYDEPAYARLREELTRRGIAFPDNRFQFYDRNNRGETLK